MNNSINQIQLSISRQPSQQQIHIYSSDLLNSIKDKSRQFITSQQIEITKSHPFLLPYIYKCRKYHFKSKHNQNITNMRIASLLNDLKELKQTKPIVEQPRNIKRIERYHQFQIQNGINFNAKNNKKKTVTKEGIFRNMSFCFPLIDVFTDIQPQKLAQIAKGIHLQGGRIVQFNLEMSKKEAEFILIDPKADIARLKQILKERVSYSQIVDYRWVEQCLRLFRKIPIGQHNLLRIYEKSKQRMITVSTNNNIASQSKSQDQIKMDVQQNKNQLQQDQSLTELIQQQEKKTNEKAQQTNLKNQDVKSKQIKDNSLQICELNLQEHKIEDAIVKDDIKIENVKQQQINESVNDSQSQKTEKMESQDQNGQEPKRGYYRATRQIDQRLKQQQIESSLKLQPEQMQATKMPTNSQSRRKVKLPIGSHEFEVNNAIVQQLTRMQKHYHAEGNRKHFAYMNAIAQIKNYGKQIKNADELKNVCGLGKQMIEKVRQFLQSGSIKKIQQKTKNGLNTVPYKDLLRVHGIGSKTAQEFYHRGIKTIQDLQKNQQLLNKSQKIGLKYLKDFETRIPRQKVAKMFQLVKQTLFYVVRSDSNHQIEAVGSFRRGRATCGDIDILITRKDGAIQRNLLQNLTAELEKRKFITDHLTTPKAYDGRQSVNYMGVCCFQDEKHHRIDLKHYPVDQYAFALLYFTGSDTFNRTMRSHAHDLGLMLSDHDVRKKQRNGRSKIWKGGKLPVCYNEKDIFDLLSMEYRSPAQREL